MRLIPATLATLLTVTSAAAQPVADGAPNRPEITPAFPEQTEAPALLTDPAPQMDAITEALDTPWAIVVLPGTAGYLVTERGGALRHVTRAGEISAPIAGVPEVLAERQGGLLDVEIAADFTDSRRIYLTYSKPAGFRRSVSAALSAVLSPDHTALTDPRDLFEQTPPSIAPAHYGSRIVPLPDGTLAITTGDRFLGDDLAQDPMTSYGAVIRVTTDGAPAPDNPYIGRDDALPEIYSQGHRNVQGAAVHPETGALWTIEHGPAGGDELNVITAGGNYGWPLVSYGTNYSGTEVADGRAAHAPDFVPPRYYWDPVIAPGGMIFYDGEMFPDWQGDLLAAGLVAQAVVRLDIVDGIVRGEERLADGIGRVRDVAIDHDGAVLFLTNAGDASAIMRLSR